jgi:hypothetical protein
MICSYLMLAAVLLVALATPVMAIDFTYNTTFDSVRGGRAYPITWENALGPVDVVVRWVMTITLIENGTTNEATMTMTSTLAGEYGGLLRLLSTNLRVIEDVTGTQCLWTPITSDDPFSARMTIRDASSFSCTGVIIRTPERLVVWYFSRTLAVSLTLMKQSTISTSVSSISILTTGVPSGNNGRGGNSSLVASSNIGTTGSATANRGPIVTTVETQVDYMSPGKRIGLVFSVVVVVNCVFGGVLVLIYRQRRRMRVVAIDSNGNVRQELDSRVIEVVTRDLGVMELPTMREPCEMDIRRL